MSAARHSDRAAGALADMGATDPAIAALALWCAHRDDPGATRTRGETILYGPDFAALPRHEQIGLAAHQILHVALRHPARGAGLAERLGPAFSADLYALAADAIVNETLLAGGHALPRPAVRLTELLAEAVGRQVLPAAALADWDAERLATALMGDAGTRQRAADYATRRQFTPDLAPSEQTDPSPAPEPEWRARRMRAMQTGRAAGSGIGPLFQTLADLAPPRIAWELRLRRLLTRAVTDAPRPTHRRPARRWLAMEAHARATGGPTPIFEPGIQRLATRPRLAVCIDTSSSVDDLTLRLLASECAGIARRTGAETHVLGFDEAVHTRATLGPGAWESTLQGLELNRGGGTSYLEVLEAAARLEPALIVVLTDLDGPMGERPPVPVLWVTPDAPGMHPPFGQVLSLAGDAPA